MDESPALIFNWCDFNEDFTEITEEIQQLMDECAKDIKDEKYADYPFEYLSDFGKAFELLTNEKLKPFSNYVLYAIAYEQEAGRLKSDTAYFAFDMGYGTKMQGKELDENYLISNSFYCPVTAEKLFGIGFEPKQLPPSVEIYYVLDSKDNKVTTIKYISDYFKEELKKLNIDISDNICDATVLNKFINSNFCTDFALHSVTSAESKVQAIHSFVINMNYFEEEEENPYEHLPDMNTFNALLDRYKNNEPQIDGYAIYIKQNSENSSSFYFYNSIQKPYVSFEEWEELMPAILFSDFKNKPYSDIPSAKFEELNSLFCSYCLGGWGTSAADSKGIEQLKEFMKYTNEALDESEIIFLGPIDQLFIANTEFTTTLITKFGKNPQENATEYLQFLKDYKN